MLIHHWLFSSPLLNGDMYLDPGSGSFLLQLLIAGLVGAGFVVKAFFTRSGQPKDNNTNTQP